jgi:hypothetical protein
MLVGKNKGIMRHFINQMGHWRTERQIGPQWLEVTGEQSAKGSIIPVDHLMGE